MVSPEKCSTKKSFVQRSFQKGDEGRALNELLSPPTPFKLGEKTEGKITVRRVRERTEAGRGQVLGRQEEKRGGL